MARIRKGLLTVAVLAAVAVGCGSSTGAQPSAPPPCDQKCMDETALRAMRETMKVAYNLLLQGQPVGQQDATHACLPAGTVHIVGTATSNAVQGATVVNLTYTFDGCEYQVQDTDPTQTYDMKLTGTVQEVGTIAVQPSSTTALQITSSSLTFSGTVEDPPVSYEQDACSVTANQNGNQLTATMCGRTVGLTL
jgi:hypothetical protein